MAVVNYGTLAQDILAGVGGEENVAGVVHCATGRHFRVSFALHPFIRIER